MKLCPYCHNPLSDADVNQLRDENDRLRELVRRLVYATHPADRATLIANAAELGIEADE